MVLTHIRVLQTPDNRFMIAWPSRIGPNNRYVDVCYPKTESLRNEIRQRVIDETNLELSRASKE
jgi:DNA-binding cell septation regulator SpoVG